MREALTLCRAGQFDKAEAICGELLKNEPHRAEALHLLGLIAVNRRDPGSAIERIHQAISLDSRQPRFWCSLAKAYWALGQADEAVDCMRQAIQLQPQAAKQHNDLGVMLASKSRWAEAEQCFRAVLDIEPNHAGAWNNLGIVLEHHGRPDDAIRCFQSALRADPTFADAHNSWGNALKSAGRIEEAVEQYRQAVQTQADSAEWHYNLAGGLRQLGRLEEAIHSYQEAIQLRPDFVEARVNLGNVLRDANRLDDALLQLETAVSIRPRLAPAHGSLASVLALLGQTDEAIVCYRRAVELDPTDAAAHSNLLYALNFVPGYDAQALFAEHRAWAARHAEPLTSAAAAPANDPTPERRLRVGYVSAFFRQHAVNFFIEPLIASHDRQLFEVFCYSHVQRPDAATGRVRRSCDQWRDVAHLSDEQLASRVREDRIDILVDLAGHIGGNRLLAFARRPAPVQVTYLGYQNTTGMTAMDYRLTDNLADPPSTTDQYYTERLVRLPDAFFCYRPSDEAPAVNELPALATGGVTFGSFNTFRKVAPQAIDAWLAILARVPCARLLVLENAGGSVERLLYRAAEQRGIAGDRIEMCARRAYVDYLKLQQRADIALDPFPFNGHTTTCDSVWMGVPVVMLLGDRYASRYGGSVLANVGLDECIAHSVEEYIEKAVNLALDVPRLAAMRRELRSRMADSVLLDAVAFARKVEAAYRKMWRDWCQNKPG